MFRFLQKGSYMSRNRGLLIYLEALIQRGEACYEKSSLRANAKQSSEIVITRSEKRRSNLIQNENSIVVGLVNPTYSCNCQPELMSVSCGLNPSPAFQAPSAQGRQGPRIAQLCGSLCLPKWRGGKIRSIENMKENIFTDKVYSLFTTHHSLKRPAFTLAEGATHVAHWNNSRKIAFTLAEVLITLGIIGIVAAMTMPSLITNYKIKETVSKLKKVNTTFNNAFLQAKEENGEISDWGLSNSTLDTDTDDGSIANSNYGRDKFLEILSRHLKTISMCKYSDNSCEVYRPTNLQGDIDNSDSYSNRLVLADGTIIGHLYLNNTACNTNWGSGALSQSCGSFKVDLNGSKKPNMYGKDIFQFDITANGIVPSGIATDISGNNFEESCIKSDSRMNGVGCTGWVIYNENMDYLKCPEKLGWNKAKSCK